MTPEFTEEGQREIPIKRWNILRVVQCDVRPTTMVVKNGQQKKRKMKG